MAWRIEEVYDAPCDRDMLWNYDTWTQVYHRRHLAIWTYDGAESMPMKSEERDRRRDDPLHEARAEEMRLIKAEEEAERALARALERLESAEARLRKAQARVKRRKRRVERARKELKSSQNARARGPRGRSEPKPQSEVAVQAQPLRQRAAPKPAAEPSKKEPVAAPVKETSAAPARPRARPPRDDRAAQLTPKGNNEPSA